MKKLLLMMICVPVLLFAEGNGVKVSNLSVSAGTVTFTVSWSKTGMPTLWSDTVWVFVDYNNNGVMERLPVTGATASAGTVTKISNNDKGVWIAGNARTAGAGGFSATVKLLTSVKNVAGVCAYASNYPPVGEYASATDISFTGTPDFKVVVRKSDGNTYTATVGKKESLSISNGETILSFTDKTGAPGTLGCRPSIPYNLTASATAYCAGSSVTFALSNTMPGQSYRLYKGSDPVNTLTGTNSAATFTGTFAGAGVYTAQAIADMEYCPAIMNGSLSVVSNPLPAAPKMSGGGTHCGGSMTITATYGSGGNGIRWTDGYTTASRNVGTGTYRAVTTSAAGCESGSASVTVTINNGASNGNVPDATCGTCASGFQSYGVCVPNGSTLIQRAASGCSMAEDATYGYLTSETALQAYCRTQDCTYVSYMLGSCPVCRDPSLYLADTQFGFCSGARCTSFHTDTRWCDEGLTFVVYQK
jgi:hypothetical protein